MIAIQGPAPFGKNGDRADRLSRVQANRPSNTKSKPIPKPLIVQLVKTGQVLTLNGRKASILRVLMAQGENGLTTSQAGSLWPATHLADHITDLRALGILVSCDREPFQDTRQGRYRLTTALQKVSASSGRKVRK